MNILFLQKRLLYPVNSGWRVRTLNVVKYLARWHRVTYLCNVQPHENINEVEARLRREHGCN